MKQDISGGVWAKERGLTKEEFALEIVIDKFKSLSTLEGIKLLQKIIAPVNKVSDEEIEIMAKNHFPDDIYAGNIGGATLRAVYVEIFKIGLKYQPTPIDSKEGAEEILKRQDWPKNDVIPFESMYHKTTDCILKAMREYAPQSNSEVDGLIKELVELKKYHINPYNLGDMGRVGEIINALEKTITNEP